MKQPPVTSINPIEFIYNFMKGKDAMIIQLTNVRLAFPDLWTAQAFEEGQEKKYGATFLIPKGDPQIKVIEQAILEVAAVEWKDKAKQFIDSFRHDPTKFCFRDGDSRLDTDGFPGHMYLVAKNKKRPTVVDKDKTPLTESDGKPYRGCYVNGSVKLWAQGTKHKGIRCSLRGVQFVRDGDAFGGDSIASSDEFDDLGDGANADDLA